MMDNDAAEEKSVVSQLSFGSKTAKRVAWEAWEFTVIGPHQVEVINASWGHQKADHTYTVGVEVRDGQPVPAECGCKADQYREEYDCKHKVTLATIGGLTVLHAAVNYESSGRPSSRSNAPNHSTVAAKLQPDGGTATNEGQPAIPPEACPNGDPNCPGPGGDELCCFPCFREADR